MSGDHHCSATTYLGSGEKMDASVIMIMIILLNGNCIVLMITFGILVIDSGSNRNSLVKEGTFVDLVLTEAQVPELVAFLVVGQVEGNRRIPLPHPRVSETNESRS